MNYENFQLMLPEPMKHEEAIDIAIYADKEFINNVIINSDNLIHNRISRQDEPDDIIANVTNRN